MLQVCGKFFVFETAILWFFTFPLPDFFEHCGFCYFPLNLQNKEFRSVVSSICLASLETCK